MLEQMGVIGQIEEDLAKSDLDGDEDGGLSLAARRAFNTTRLAEAKENTGCHGVCQVPVVLGYVSMVNLFPLAPCHLFFFGLGKGLLEELRHRAAARWIPGYEAGTPAPGFSPDTHQLWTRVAPFVCGVQEVERSPPRGVGVGVGVGVTAFPFMTARSGKVTVRSGWVMEDCWHHMKTFSLLTAGPLFKEARVKAIMTEKELASPAVMRSVSQLANVVTEEDGPERKAQVDTLTGEGRTRYLVDITVSARLAEGNGFVSLLVSNLHSAVCRMICQMLAFGHPLAELWMEVLMGFLKAGAKRVLPKNVCETMMRDLLFAQQINRLKAHRLYREPNKKTPIRLVGSASAAWEDAVDFKHHLEKLLDDVRRTVQGSHSYAPILAELESEEELPRNLLAEREDAKYTTMVARAQHFYLATPPPPPGPDSDDSRASARLIRAALCTTVRAIRKVDVLMAPGHMSSAKAAGLGVDAGELLVAGIHARSQDVRAKCKCKLLVAGIHARSQDGAGLGVCRRQSCKAMGTVRDAKSG
eukprot:jgi/Tetstr1/459207/TSEL_004651.t1